jgi:phosphocarrier protein
LRVEDRQLEERAVRRRVTIVNTRGLHARAAARFVKTAETFAAEISVSKDSTVVSGSSIMGLMMLAAGPGCDIEVEARGVEAEQAIEALAALVANKFDED